MKEEVEQDVRKRRAEVMEAEEQDKGKEEPPKPPHKRARTLKKAALTRSPYMLRSRARRGHGP